MNELKVQYFGAIQEGYAENDGYMPIHQLSVFCGTQGTGKSTVAKLYSTFVWLEKALTRGDFSVDYVIQYNRFVKKFLAYQSISGYIKPNSFLHYKGTNYDFLYENEKLEVVEHKNALEYTRPQVMYFPAERNLLSVIEKASGVKGMPDALGTMLEDYNIACRSLSESVPLPINGVSFSYDKLNKISHVIGQGYNVRMSEASSGIQSLSPLFITLNYLSDSVRANPDTEATKVSQEEKERIDKRITDLLLDETIDDSTRSMLIKKLSDNKNVRLVSIIEELEQNLFPSSQESVLYHIIQLSAHGTDQLLLTTHSPYVLNYLMLAIKAKQVEQLVANDMDEKDLEAIVPKYARIDGSSVVVYQLDTEGKIHRLPSYEDMPSDENYLNLSMMETNTKYSNLIEIQSRYE